MKLEIKHIYAYMPYGLKIKYPNEIYTVEVINEADYVNNEYPLSTVIHCIETQDLSPLNFKPLLKPLSELSDVTLNMLYNSGCVGINPANIFDCIKNGVVPYNVTCELMVNHYDVFGLIDNGLAEVLSD